MMAGRLLITRALVRGGGEASAEEDTHIAASSSGKNYYGTSYLYRTRVRQWCVL